MNIPNALSLLRVPLALLFVFNSLFIKLTVILLAMMSDVMDGYLARKSRAVSKLGTILDPLTDKFFVYFLLALFFLQDKIAPWQALAVISRDIFLLIFALYLTTANRWKEFIIQSVKFGKMSTTLQFLLLISLTLNYFPPPHFYTLFIVFGGLAFLEFYKILSTPQQN